MQYQVVLKGQNGWGEIQVEYDNVQDFVEFMVANNYPFSQWQQNYGLLRSELVGQPMFSNLIGPMYGGEDCIRYENQAAYNVLSN